MEVEPMHAPPENILNEELETLIIASIQTLKRSNKKCGKDEVLQLVNNSLEKEISREIFENILYRLIEDQSVKLNALKLNVQNLLVTAKRISIEQRKETYCWYWKQRRQRIPP